MRLASVAFGCALVSSIAFVSFPLSAGAAEAPGSAPSVTPVRHFTVSAGPAALAINEFVPGPSHDWDGSGAFSSRDDEWIEVVNPGAAPLDLTKPCQHRISPDLILRLNFFFLQFFQSQLFIKPNVLKCL